MKAKFKYIILVCLLLFSLSSYSQRLLVENGKVIIDTYGMNKDVLAVTEAQQNARKNPDTGQTLPHQGIRSPINMQISGKFEIATSDYDSGSVGNLTDICKNKGKEWRIPTFHESLLMLLFYDDIVSLKNSGTISKNFNLPKTDRHRYYLSSTPAVKGIMCITWLLNSGSVKVGYFTELFNYPFKYSVRCIRDISQ